MGDFRACVGGFRVGIGVKPTEDPGWAEEAHRRWPEGRSEQGKGRPSKDCALQRGVSVSAGERANHFNGAERRRAGKLTQIRIFVSGLTSCFQPLAFYLRNRDVRNELEKVFMEMI